MRARARRARDTRWLYQAERTLLKGNDHANADRPIGYLRSLAKRVWKAEAPEGRRMPSIKATRGMKYGDSLTSFCAGFTEIELARHHRTVLVLLHELTHALGPYQHGAKFVRLYFHLLKKYAGYNRWFLEMVASERGIAL